MSTQEKTSAEKIGDYLDDFKPDFRKKNEIWLTSTYTLRRTIGWAGMLLPFLLYYILKFDSDHGEPLYSISHYYYTKASGVFVAILCLLAVFLIIYKGYELRDLILSMIAGFSALIIAFFPTGNLTEICCDPEMTYLVTHLPENSFRTGLHNGAAAVFFLTLAYMSIFLFTKSNKPKESRTKTKNTKNIIYRVCGILMILSVVAIFCGGYLGWINSEFYDNNQLTFWFETLAIECFGFSWLTKGETLSGDLDA